MMSSLQQSDGIGVCVGTGDGIGVCVGTGDGIGVCVGMGDGIGVCVGMGDGIGVCVGSHETTRVAARNITGNKNTANTLTDLLLMGVTLQSMLVDSSAILHVLRLEGKYKNF
jgi:hypothetical protein